MEKINKSIVSKMVYGAIIGDCLGVPVEFFTRKELEDNPIEDMTGFGTHYKPSGTWSDDSSLILAQMDGLTYPANRKLIAQNFVDWKFKNKYCQDSIFDIGNTTSRAIAQINFDIFNNKFDDDKEYCTEDSSSGNGALMRIFPIVFICVNNSLNFEERKNIIYNMASLTHGSNISKIVCLVYIEILYYILLGHDIISSINIVKNELSTYDTSFIKNIFNKKFLKTNKKHIRSDGYCLHTLEAAIWCVYNSSSYKEAVLKAVNLGDDTDTTACVAGAMAALYFDEIDIYWKQQIYKADIIDDVISKFCVQNNIF